MKHPIIFRVFVAIVALLAWGLLQAFLKQDERRPVSPAFRAELQESARSALREADRKADAAFAKEFQQSLAERKNNPETAGKSRP